MFYVKHFGLPCKFALPFMHRLRALRSAGFFQKCLCAVSRANWMYVSVLISSPCLKHHLVAACSVSLPIQGDWGLGRVWLKITAWEHHQENETTFELFCHLSVWWRNLHSKNKQKKPTEFWVYLLFVKFYFEIKKWEHTPGIGIKVKILNIFHCDSPRAHRIDC